MRLVIQRVSEARVRVEDRVVGEIGAGLLILVGCGSGDGPQEADWLARKAAGLRIFRDAEGKMNRSLIELGAAALVVSQFTLYGQCEKGRRPSFALAAPGALAEPLVEAFVTALRRAGVERVETGLFGADMAVELVNDGPVTVIVERSPEAASP